ncbi:hypothetical protein BU17DRAFT_71372 [Hysterangium stoloniferum]|nr:hypothetical protein BU17DRAFT_71372 [Hysterangium stoloniferum]
MTLSTRPFLAALLLLFSVIPSTRADCVIDSRGREFCNGISNGARVGIGIGVFVLVMIVLIALGVMRRRRIQRANQAYITNPNSQSYQPGIYPQGTYPQQPYPQQGYNQSYNAPQYPPQTHADQYHPHNDGYGPPAGYTTDPNSQPGMPPQYPVYAPPTGPPPTKQ